MKNDLRVVNTGNWSDTHKSENGFVTNLRFTTFVKIILIILKVIFMNIHHISLQFLYFTKQNLPNTIKLYKLFNMMIPLEQAETFFIFEKENIYKQTSLLASRTIQNNPNLNNEDNISCEAVTGVESHSRIKSSACHLYK